MNIASEAPDRSVGVALNAVVHTRQLVGEVRMWFLDMEIELDRLEKELRAARAQWFQRGLSKIDLTGSNANAADRAAEEYRSAGSRDPEDYVPGGDLTA